MHAVMITAANDVLITAVHAVYKHTLLDGPPLPRSPPQAQLFTSHQYGVPPGAKQHPRNPVYVHPNSTVKLLIDCLLEVGSSQGRRLLLQVAMQAACAPTPTLPTPGTDEGMRVAPGAGSAAAKIAAPAPAALTATPPAGVGCCDVQGDDRKDVGSTGAHCQRPEAAQPINHGSTCKGGSAGKPRPAWGCLLAQVCHDELLRYGHAHLSGDVTHLALTRPDLFSLSDIGALSQVVLRTLAAATPAFLSELVWAACDPTQPGRKNWLLRALRLLCTDLLASAFPQPGAFVSAGADGAEQGCVGAGRPEPDSLRKGPVSKKRKRTHPAGAKEGTDDGDDGGAEDGGPQHAATLLQQAVPCLRPAWLVAQLLPQVLHASGQSGAGSGCKGVAQVQDALTTCTQGVTGLACDSRFHVFHACMLAALFNVSLCDAYNVSCVMGIANLCQHVVL